MSSLLLDDKPLVVIPSLAVAVGLEEAIVLQQLHYWLLRSTNERDGRKWVYNTLAEWKEQFPFWSVEALRRILNGLRDKEIVLTARYNEMKIDRTLWYSIDYDKLNAICRNQQMVSGNPQMDSSDSTDPCDQNRQTNNQRIPENKEDDDDEVGKVFKLFENVMPGSLTIFISESVNDLIKTYGCKEVYGAIEKAGKANARSLSYIETILVNRAAGKDKPQKGGSNGTSKRAGSDRKVSRAEANYVMPKWG